MPTCSVVKTLTMNNTEQLQKRLVMALQRIKPIQKCFFTTWKKVNVGCIPLQMENGKK